MGLLEPINTRVTDPRYFLDTPQQGRTPPQPVPSAVPLLLVLPLVSRSPPRSVPSGSHLTEGWEPQPPVTDGKWGSGSTSRAPGGGMARPAGAVTVMSLPQDMFHWQIMDGNLTGNIREFLPIVGEAPS